MGHANKKTGEGFAVGLHVDTSLGIKSHKVFMAHQVDVCYIQVPAQMEGGDLELFAYNDGVTPATERQPDQVVQPEENTHVCFRGDAYHQVRAFKSGGKGARVSLVVEQYIVDEDYYWLTKPFEISKKGMQMM